MVLTGWGGKGLITQKVLPRNDVAPQCFYSQTRPSGSKMINITRIKQTQSFCRSAAEAESLYPIWDL